MTLSIENIPDEQRTTVKFADYLMDDDAFYDFCRQNDHLKFERNPDGTIVAMPNTGEKPELETRKSPPGSTSGQSRLVDWYSIRQRPSNCQTGPRGHRMLPE